MEQINFGVAPSRFDLRDYKLKFKKGIATTKYYPEQFELKMPKIKAQGIVGSCVAHSLATVIEYYNFQETNEYKEMSTSYIYGNRKNSSWKKPGMRVRDALKNGCEYGDVNKNLMPKNIEVPEAITYFEKEGLKLKEIGQINRIKKFFKITSANAMKECLMNYGPILVIIKWYSNNVVDGQAVLKSSNNKKYYNGQHCMVCYGWNEKGWKIQNSWGYGWGKMGKAILPFDTDFVEVWGIIDQENLNDDNLEIITPCKNNASALMAKGINNIVNLILGRR